MMKNKIWLGIILLCGTLNLFVILNLTAQFIDTQEPDSERQMLSVESNPHTSAQSSDASQLTSHHISNINITVSAGQRILLFASYRSGSSFIGEILHQENTFYAFEPLGFFSLGKNVKPFIRETFLSKNASQYLHDMFHCQFERLKNHSAKYAKIKINQRKDWITRCFMGIKTFEKAEQTCQKATSIVTKIVRVKYLQDIMHLLEEGIKIVHLIRDPRGILTSRLARSGPNFRRRVLYNQAKRASYFKSNAHKHCTKLETNNEYLVNVTKEQNSSLNQILRNNYVLIRYEDFAYHPESMVRKLLNFTKTKPRDNLYPWLKEITNKQSSSVYSVERKSNQTAGKWRRVLPYYLVKIIEEECQLVLDTYGYKTVTSEAQLRNTSLSLMTGLPKDIPQL